MSAAVALLEYAESKGVKVHLVNDAVRLTGGQTEVQQVAATIRKYREIILSWLQKSPVGQVASEALDQLAAGKYYSHHFGCVTCIHAGQTRGMRCPIGLKLWGTYLYSATSVHVGVQYEQT